MTLADRFLSFCRKQRVVVNDETPEWAPVLSGVPRGTVLDPLLFSLYIDIFTDIVSEMTADNCVCYRKITNIENPLKLQEDISKIYNIYNIKGYRQISSIQDNCPAST